MSNNASKGILNIPALQFESPKIDLTTVTQIQSALEEMSRDMGRAGDYVQKIIKEHEDIWAKQQAIWDEYWKEQTKQIAEGMKRVDNAFQKSEAVGKYGWTIPPRCYARRNRQHVRSDNRRGVG
jgi:hypothetical protein